MVEKIIQKAASSQPSLADVHLSAALTQISVAYIQEESHYIADKVFPTVPVQHQTDRYFSFSKDDFFRDEAQLRADGAESAGGGFTLTTKTYSAGVWAWHKDIGEQTRRNADPAVDIDVVTTKLVMQRLLIRRERFFSTTYMTTGVWGTDITGVSSSPSATQTIQWNDDGNSDPITDVQVGMTTILQNTGLEANLLVLTYPVYAALRKHPLIVDRIKYTTPTFNGTVTPALLAQLFDIEEVVVSRAVYNSSAEGVAGSYSFVMGKSALLVHRTRSPGLMMATAGYIFAWAGFTGMNTVGIRVQQMPIPLHGLGATRIEGEAAWDMKVVSSDLGYFYSAIVA